MKKKKYMGLLVALFMVLSFAATASAENFKMLTAWAPNFVFNEGVIPSFMKNLEESSEGKFKISTFGPEVVPTFEQLQPVQTGIFDLAHTYSAYHMGSIAVGVAMDATEADPVKRRETGLFAAIDKEYNKIGIKLISFPPLTPYHFITRDPMTGKKPSLDGRKLRSIPSLQNLIQNLGGSPVTMAGGDVYTSLQKGIIDGAPWTQVGVKDFKWFEVADYMVRPSFGYVSTMILMNLDKYNSLSPEKRKWLDEAGRKTEIEAQAYFSGLIKDEIAFLKTKGMKETQMHSDDAENIEKYWNDGLWTMAKSTSGVAGQEIHDLALETGMTE
ncbi:MAG: hypothetical protein GWN87_00210 [Desulfuromonadales bacterium]|nr:hypothetical protein [Desulfuromonadales bacterium]NIS39208.1 hypothetical protein [Desulfuromonadales bacterium]